MAVEERSGTLEVYLLDVHVGRIDYRSHHNEMSFAYDRDYLSSSEAVALSYSLPLRAEPFESERTTVYFENLLPPDQVRRKLGPILHISRHNVFGFLEALGGDCAGAISLWPPNVVPFRSPRCFRELKADESASILSALKKRPLFVNGVEGYRISGAGAQNKLIACLNGDRVSLPLFGTPSTHIIKPSAEDYPDSVHNEAFVMRLASAVGVRAAKSGLVRIGDRPYYWTERFDREVVDGQIRRLHQEDFCQVLGVSGELKYESEGGPSFADCMSVMKKMGLSLADRLSFVDRMIFNFLVGNADAHGKNFSVLYRGSEGRTLAPAYDVMCTRVYPNLSQTNAMSIGGSVRFSDVSRTSFSRMAEEAGMRPALVLGRLDEMLGRIVPAAERLAREFSVEWPSDVYAKIIEVIGGQANEIG